MAAGSALQGHLCSIHRSCRIETLIISMLPFSGLGFWGDPTAVQLLVLHATCSLALMAMHPTCAGPIHGALRQKLLLQNAKLPL